MPAVVYVKGLKGLELAIRRDFKLLERQARSAAARTARRTRSYVAENTLPIAFRELLSSIHVDLSRVREGVVSLVADAPHAAAVEFGSRPHTPPLEPLIRWVKLRGMQGISRRKLRGTTSARHADTIAATIAAMRVHSSADRKRIERASMRAESRSLRAGASAFEASDAGTAARTRMAARTGSTPIDAATQIARAIQMAIAKRGTKPHFYFGKAVGPSMAFLDEEISRALFGAEGE